MNPVAASFGRIRTAPIAKAAIGAKSGLTAIAPTTIGAESMRIATEAMTPASANSSTSPQLGEPLLAIRARHVLPDHGVAGVAGGRTLDGRRAARDRRVDALDVDRAASATPSCAQVADDVARVLLGHVAGHDIARRLQRGGAIAR